MPAGSGLSQARLSPVIQGGSVKEHLISEIRTLTKRIGQAARGGVTELAERLRLTRTELAVRLAREFDTWLLVNAQGRSEFVDRETFTRRAESWKERKLLEALSAQPAPATEPAPSGEAPAPAAPGADPVREIFGEPISIYTRTQALEDGVLVDVTPFGLRMLQASGRPHRGPLGDRFRSPSGPGR